jgi:predicted nucleic acid-binding protein
MELVIDANILMSALIATEGKTYDLIFNESIKLFSVDKLMHELDKYKSEILEKSGLSEYDFDIFVSLISSEIEFIPYSELNKFISEAEKISPDPNDMEYFALALKMECAIWSNDKKLKNQDKVKVYSTEDLVKVLH